jgi:mono/diheme cytochrome c family protein
MFRHWRSAKILMFGAVAWAGAALWAVDGTAAAARLQTSPNGHSAAAADIQPILGKYCATCHSDRLKTGGLSLASADPAQIGDHPELWEKVVRKLEAGAMPPAGAPRPDAATYQTVRMAIERELDQAAKARPNPGKLPLLHRLTRTEYQNTIRDLLAVDALPKEMDYSLLLPPDNASSGFDNIADLLFVSPTTMERYLDAARKISRLAIGDPRMPLMVNTYRLPGHLPQDQRIDELPFGTRGGIGVRSTFPLDGEYAIKIELAGFAREPHQVEVSVDGERVQLLTIGDQPAQGGGRGTPPARAGGGRGRGANRTLELRTTIHAGPRLVGVTFIEHSEARDESTVRPRLRSRGPLPAIASVTISGPYNGAAPTDTPSRRRIFVCRPDAATDAPACAKRVLLTLARRAYRRPATAADLDDLMPFYTAGFREGGFDTGIERALDRILVSPQFLFRIERDPVHAEPGTPYRISNLELASRLSFFLWSSIPDEELLTAAEQGKLSDPAVLEAQVRRMLGDTRAESLVTNFAAQWLYLRDIDNKKPDELLFPDFDESLRQAFRRETDLFLDSILRGNHSVLDLLSANYTFANERLARHYGIPHVKGSYFRRVTLPDDSPRRGLLGQGSILTLTSYANRTSPVLRGKWILENLLSSPPPPPPPNVPALKTEGKEPGKKLSMREAMIQHRANPACASCHARMDPLGFAMENFDAIGRWRDQDEGTPIDASGVLPDGTHFDGPAGLEKALLAHPEQFVHTVAEKLLMYAIGRNVQYFDAPAVRAIVRDAASTHYSFASLVLGVVRSAPFQMRTAHGDEKAEPSAPVTSAAENRSGR